jgi:type IV secretory pathway VirB4 component
MWQTYAKKDITEHSDFKTVEYPTMNDLIEILQGIVGAESLAERLAKYTQGTFAGLLNMPTNVVLNNQLVVFSIRDLEDQLRPIAMYIILGYIWNIVRSQLKRRILVLDEAWIMMQNEDSARFVFGIAKRARKYYLGLTTITQDVADFMASPYGKPIVTNSSIQLLLKQSPAAINIIAETFFLTEGEKYLLLESDVGEGIFFAGQKHAAIKIYASYVEDQIITTDPKQLLEIKESQDQVN